MSSGDATTMDTTSLFPYEEMSHTGFCHKNIGKRVKIGGTLYHFSNLYYYPGTNHYEIELLLPQVGTRSFSWMNLKQMTIEWMEEIE